MKKRTKKEDKIAQEIQQINTLPAAGPAPSIPFGESKCQRKDKRLKDCLTRELPH